MDKITKKYILKNYQNPSDFVKMVKNAILIQSKRKDFELRMSTFGSVYDKICYGCAATCTIQEIANKNFYPSNAAIFGRSSRAKYLNFSKITLEAVEHVANDLRCGNLHSLFSFYNKSELYEFVYSKTYKKFRKFKNETKTNNLYLHWMSHYATEFAWKVYKTKRTSNFMRGLNLIINILKENNL